MSETTHRWCVAGHQAFKVARNVVARWHRSDPELDWIACSEALPGCDREMAELIERLSHVNCFQWHLEDESRATHDLRRAGQLKREIDRSNQRRVDGINTINRHCFERFRGIAGPSAVTLTESPGSVYDRITILALKIDHCRDAERVPILQEEATDLSEGLDRIIQELESGASRMKLYETLKIYET